VVKNHQVKQQVSHISGSIKTLSVRRRHVCQISEYLPFF